MNVNVPNLKRMTAEEYAQWAQRQEAGRFELIDGIVVQMNSERAEHGRAKLNTAVALRTALKALGVAGEVFGDGMAVRIGERLVHEPDAMLRLGLRLRGDVVLVDDPLIVVEVLSPQSGPIDTGTKLVNYFSLPSVQHYLVINTLQQLVLHYTRGDDGKPVMRPPVSAGYVELDPPGLAIAIADIFEW